MKHLRPLFPILLGLAIGCSDPPRVGVIDVQQAFQRSPLAMVSALELKGELGSGQRELQRLGRSLAELRKQLAYGDLDLDAEQRRQIEARIADDAARLRELQQQHRTRLTAAQERHGEAMIARVEEVAREVAKREGLVLLLRNDGVLYEADEGLERVDITEAVARALLDRINPTEIPTPGSDS